MRKAKEVSLEHFILLAIETQQPLSEVFLKFEERETGRPREELWELMRTRMAVMRHALKRGLDSPQRSRSGYLDGEAHGLLRRSPRRPLHCGG